MIESSATDEMSNMRRPLLNDMIMAEHKHYSTCIEYCPVDSMVGCFVPPSLHVARDNSIQLALLSLSIDS